MNNENRKYLVEDMTPNRYNTGKFSIVEVVEDHSINNQNLTHEENEIHDIKDDSL